MITASGIFIKLAAGKTESPFIFIGDLVHDDSIYIPHIREGYCLIFAFIFGTTISSDLFVETIASA